MLIYCTECHKEISNEAYTCPHCGKKIEKTKIGNKLIDAIAMVTLFFSAMFIWARMYGAYLVPLFWLLYYGVLYEKYKDDRTVDVSGLKSSFIAVGIAFFIPIGLIIIL